MRYYKMVYSFVVFKTVILITRENYYEVSPHIYIYIMKNYVDYKKKIFISIRGVNEDTYTI